MENALRQELRDGTARAHERLEAGLRLLEPPLDRERYLKLLQRFHGFHASWEPVIATWLPVEFHALRSKLSLLRTDLTAMGLDGPSIDTLPDCAEAATLCATPEAALGSLYVIEVQPWVAS